MNDMYDCTDRCRSEIHGEILCAALTKRSLTDSQLCAYLNSICICCGTVRDRFGRTALHLAASCGRTNVAKWLVQYKHANINAKDLESGYTPLHRSIFYGKIHTAISLLRLGACLNTNDFNGLSSLEHVMKDLNLPLEPCQLKSGEIYVWGQNTNYTLGPQQARSIPERLDVFHKEHPDLEVSAVCLEKFHSILLTADGKVFASGHGQGGRLGLSSEESVLQPKLIRFCATVNPSPIKQASIARDHSVFLNEEGQVFTCGINKHKVLGLNPPPPNVLAPRHVQQLNEIITGICAGRYHTVAYTKKHIYTWGLHGGQLGHDKTGEKYIVFPKLVTCMFGTKSDISLVAASNGATVIYTTKGDIYVLHEHQCRKIASRQMNITSISIVGGKLNVGEIDDSKEMYELKVIAISSSGNLYLWRESSPQFSRCIFSVNRALKVTHSTLNANEILFVTNEGEAFQGFIKSKKSKIESCDQQKKSTFYEEDCQLLKLKKINRVFRGFAIYSDLKGLNYAVLQYNPKTYQRLIPDISSSTFENDLIFLLEEADEEDQVHDIIFKVNSYNFPAHRFICAMASEALEDLFSKYKCNDIIELDNVNEYIFANLLRYIYAGSCDILDTSKYQECCNNYLSSLQRDNKKDETEKGEKATTAKEKTDNPLYALRSLSKRLGLKQLHKHLEGICFVNGSIKFRQQKTSKRQRPRREMFPQFYDTKIKSKDGKVIHAHKCILVARMEYFENLFSVRWNMTSDEISLPFPHSVLELLIDYLYLDELPSTLKLEMDLACNLLVAADQLLLQRLKEMCELAISSQLSLKNVSQLLQFSYTYNAPQLKQCCMEFICLNLAALLELRVLETIENSILYDLSEFYATFNSNIYHRVITPYSDAPSDEVITAAEAEHAVVLTDPENDEVVTKQVTKSSRKRNRARKSSENTSKKEVLTEKSCNNSDSNKENENVKDRNIEEKEQRLSLKVDKSEENRVRAIIAAQEKISCDNITSNYSKLPLKKEVDFDMEEFPDLGSNLTQSSYSKSPGKSEKVETKCKFTKLSQKQRKRMSSESSIHDQENTNMSVSPKNPWKMLPDPITPIGSPECKATIDSIITDEKKKKENLAKMKSKSLLYTQIEDQAIEDLLQFYNADKVCDEIITVSRVQKTVLASPTWIHSNKPKT